MIQFPPVIIVIVSSLLLIGCTSSAAAPDPIPIAGNRLVALTTALINGTHWGQVVLREGNDADYKGKGDAKLFGLGTLTIAQAKNLNADVAKLLAIPSADILAWSQGNDSSKSAAIDGLVHELLANPAPSDPRLPVNVLISYMSKRLTGPEEFFVRAVANLGQLNLELDHDGDQLQDLFKFYIALGMHQLYLPTTEQDMKDAGKELASTSAVAPYDTNADAYYMMFKKLNVWFDKNSGHKDKVSLARDLLQDPDVQPLLPALKSLPPKRVAFLGHSLMMSVHWSTYGSWCDIAAEVVKAVNPNFDYKDFQSGGLTAVRAVREHLDNLLAYKPTDVYMMLFLRTPEDRDVMTKMVNQITATGAEVYIINDVRSYNRRPSSRAATRPGGDINDFYEGLAQKPHVHLIDYATVAKNTPGHESWIAVDGIHMQTPGHIFFAKETLKRWAAEKP